MRIVNKRNAILGWLTWRVGKRFAKKKAKGAMPAIEGKRPNKPAIVTAAAALGGALLFWRKKKKSGGEQPGGA